MINRLFKILQLPFYMILTFIGVIISCLLIPIDIVTYIIKGKGSLFINMMGKISDIIEKYLGKL